MMKVKICLLTAVTSFHQKVKCMTATAICCRTHTFGVLLTFSILLLLPLVSHLQGGQEFVFRWPTNKIRWYVCDCFSMRTLSTTSWWIPIAMQRRRWRECRIDVAPAHRTGNRLPLTTCGCFFRRYHTARNHTQATTTVILVHQSTAGDADFRKNHEQIQIYIDYEVPALHEQRWIRRVHTLKLKKIWKVYHVMTSAWKRVW